jgi:hypothetical protein
MERKAFITYPKSESDFDTINKEIELLCENVIMDILDLPSIIDTICKYTHLEEDKIDIIKTIGHEFILYYCHDHGDLVKLTFFPRHILLNDLSEKDNLCKAIKAIIISINLNKNLDLSTRK